MRTTVFQSSMSRALAVCLLLVATTAASAQEVDSSRRAALGQWWTTSPRYTASAGALGVTNWGGNPYGLAADGEHLWVAFRLGSTGYLNQFRASDGARIAGWGGFPGIYAVLVAAGRVFFTTFASTSGAPGALYSFSPAQDTSPWKVADVGVNPVSIAYGGSRFWVANSGGGGAPGSVSILTPGTTWTVQTITTGFQAPNGILHDGNNAWVTDTGADTLLELRNDGSIANTIAVGSDPGIPIFDGKHIWVPNTGGASVTVVDAAAGVVTSTLTGNGLSFPLYAAFDGKRVLVTNVLGQQRVSLWRAADLSAIGAYSTGTGTGPWAACSDGIDFWITLNSAGSLARF